MVSPQKTQHALSDTLRQVRLEYLPIFSIICITFTSTGRNNQSLNLEMSHNQKIKSTQGDQTKIVTQTIKRVAVASKFSFPPQLVPPLENPTLTKTSLFSEKKKNHTVTKAVFWEQIGYSEQHAEFQIPQVVIGPVSSSSGWDQLLGHSKRTVACYLPVSPNHVYSAFLCVVLKSGRRPLCWPVSSR